MRPARRPLSVRDVATLLQKSERARDAILVGGQALNVWAVRLGLAAEAAALSDGIDFFASRADAVAVGRDWGADVVVPSVDDHTPHAALVTLDIDHEEREIDFLSAIAGVDTDELRRWSSRVTGRGFEFRVMHPLHVIESQLENVYGSLRRRDEQGGEYYAGRVGLAVKVAGAAIALLLKEKRIREALKGAERIAQIAQRRPSHEAFSRDGIDLLDAIPEDTVWPEDFTARRLPQIQQRVGVKRQRYQSRRKRPGNA